MSHTHNPNTQREGFGSFFGSFVAAAGSAIGLGNLWRFPYVMGNNGGAAFILLYVFFIITICMPVMLAEFSIGRKAKANPFSAFKKLAPHSAWQSFGIITVVTAFFIISFYSVVGGWSIDYLSTYIKALFTKNTITDTSAYFQTVTTSTIRPLIFTVIFLGLTAYVIASGVQKGIEKFSKVLMPLLFVMVILIALRSITLDGAGAGLSFLLKPDFSKVNSNTIIAALGQAFFSLSIGMGVILTYGSYTKDDVNLTKLATSTVIADTCFAIIAGMAIMPAVFAFGISPGQGPGLVFVTLPNIFSQIPMGELIAVIFFITLLVAALTSSISLMEVIALFFLEVFKISRRKATFITFTICSLTAMLCSLSQGTLSEFTIFGKNIFDVLDYASSNVLLPLGGIILSLFAGWRLKREELQNELTSYGKYTFKLIGFLSFILRYVAPIAIFLVFLSSIGLLKF